MNRYKLLLRIMEKKRVWRRFFALIMLLVAAVLVLVSPVEDALYGLLRVVLTAECSGSGELVTSAADSSDWTHLGETAGLGGIGP